MFLTLFKSIQKTMSYLTPQQNFARLAQQAKNTEGFDRDPKTGDTQLHRVFREPFDQAKINETFQMLDEESTLTLSSIVNNEGKIPWNLAMENLDKPLRKEMHTKFFNLTKKQIIKPLNELVDQDEVLSRYHKNMMPKKLQHNLAIACDAVNYTRSFNLESCTHPSANRLNEDEFYDLSNRLESVRINTESRLRKKVTRLIDHCKEPRHSIPMLKMVITSATSSKAKTGNCHEFTLIALNYLVRDRKENNAEILAIENGDHVFVSIGGCREEEDLDSGYLGENAVICDPHAGEVYPAHELQMRMTTHTMVRSPERFFLWANLQTSYNPKYHAIKPVFRLK